MCTHIPGTITIHTLTTIVCLEVLDIDCNPVFVYIHMWNHDTRTLDVHIAGWYF